jgi:hypothetical protein
VSLATTTLPAFGGDRSVTIPIGGEVVSDRLRLRFEPFQDLAVSAYVPAAPAGATQHAVARQTSISLTAPGQRRPQLWGVRALGHSW